ncbi:unnamed protein product [Urochloa humidicola]
MSDSWGRVESETSGMHIASTWKLPINCSTGYLNKYQPTMNAKQDVSSKVLKQILKNQQTLARQIEVTEQIVVQLSINQMNNRKEEPPNSTSSDIVVDDVPVEVIWDEEMVSANQNQLAHGDDYLEAGCIVLDERPQVEVLWDEQMQFDKGMHDGLLQQLASGQEYFDSEQMTVKVEHKVEEVDTDAIDAFLLGDLNFASVVFDEMPNKDLIWDEELSVGLNTNLVSLQELTDFGQCLCSEKSKPSAEPVIKDVLSKDSRNLFMLGARYQDSDEMHLQIDNESMADHVDSRDPMPSDLEAPDSSLHQQSMCASYLSDKKETPTIKLADDELLIYVGGSSLFIDQFMEFNVSVHTCFLNHAECQHPKLCKMASSVRRQWDPGIK